MIAAALVGLVAMATTYVVVDGVHVHLRFSPSTKGEIVTGEDLKPTFPAKGAMFPYLGTEGNFYKISYLNTPVYISRDYSHLKEETSKKTTASNAEKTKVVVVDGVDVRLRRTASTNGEVVRNNGKNVHPKKGSSYKYLGTEGNFYKIDFNGEALYISRDYTHLKNK